MSSLPGTSMATAVTRRQRLGATWLLVAWLCLFTFTWGAWLFLFSLTDGFERSVPDQIRWLLPIAAWAIADVPEGSGGFYALPPVHVIVVAILGLLLAASIVQNLTSAIANAKGRRFISARRLRDEERNLKAQLRQRSRAGLFHRGRAKFVRLGLVLIGSAVILGTVLLYPATATGAGGRVLQLQWGLPMWVCAVTSVVLVLCCLAALPFGPEDDVVIDALGNLSGETEDVPEGSAFPLSAQPVQGTASSATLATGACPRCGVLQRDGGRFCSSCGTDLVSARSVSPAPAPPMPPAALGPPLLVRLATAVFWVVGIPLLIVGGLSFVLANVADDADAKTFAAAVDELGGDLARAEARTAAVRAPTDALTEAMRAYTASLEELAAAHSALVDGVNRSWEEFTASGSRAIARNELAPIINRYQEAVADQKSKQAALDAAVTRLQQQVSP